MLLGGARPPLGTAHANAVFDAHPAAGRAGRVGERAKLARARVGVRRDTDGLGIEGGYWVLVLHHV